MSQGADDDTERNLDPTPQKLEKAREKGEFARSTDISVAASYAGLLLGSLAIGSQTIDDAGAALAVLIDQSDSLSTLFFEGAPSAPFGGILITVGMALAPWLMFPFLLVLASILVQRAFVVTVSKLQPKLSRISLISNAKNKFGRSGLFEFFKSFVKLVLYSVCLGIFLNRNLPEIVVSMAYGPRAVAQLMLEMCAGFLIITVVISGLIGLIDMVWQHFEHRRKNQMSHKEIADETKESEGDPYIKQQRRMRAQEAANSQMMADVPGADVILMNPTHYAIALKWSREPGTAPVCVAKGIDEIALRIRDIGLEAGVPLHRDPPTARALYATAEIGEEIDPLHYAPVAAAIRFAEEMRQKAKGKTH